MAVTTALRAAVVTVALAGATLFGAQAALADDATPGTGTGTGSSQTGTPAPGTTTPAPGTTNGNNPWD
ncbi:MULTISPECIES: hypothetical protein [Streptomyces]|uniref:Uncharacterized protein n=1 Tax=Streptomyces lichenis TaxID=2306967 RepID=A0ABT0IBY9_9ACTN|nr:hypothetical protein [Streptomyces lichenis]MCK8678849.1 hypothetical protein [Streptomyces lichenis]